jgi:molybdate transport system ATP-binding protein
MTVLDVTLSGSQGEFVLDAAFATGGESVTALFGRSGAGKSTIIEMIAGLRRPRSGRVAIGGAVLFDSAAGINLAPHRRRIGMVFQDGRLLPHYSVSGNLTYGMNRRVAGAASLDFDKVVETLGIGSLLDRRPARLSGGERQRVAIGRALLSNPRLLMMDEPLASLDGARKAELLPFLARISQDFAVPVLYVTHAIDEILRLADRLVLLEQGKVIASGAVEDVMNSSDFLAISVPFGGLEPFSVVNGQIVAHIADSSRLTFGNGFLTLGRIDADIGTNVRLRIAAGDVLLATAQPAYLSARNIVPANIVSVGTRHRGMVDLLLDCGCLLKARITELARAELGLEPGKSVFAIIKSAAIAQSDIAPRR